MKKILLLLFACIAISAGVQGQFVESVSLGRDTIIIAVGDSERLEATITPDNAIDKTIRWRTLDATIAEIDTTTVADNAICIVKGEKAGETKVVAWSLDAGNERDTVVIRVVAPVKGIVLNETSMTITLGRDSVLKALISPLDATNDSIRWSSSDPSVVNIISTDENRYSTECRIEAISIGTGKTFIFAESVDGGFKDSCEVTVVNVQIQSFALNNDTLVLDVGEEVKIIAQIRPLEALEGVERPVTWSTNDDDERIISRISSGFDTIQTIKAEGVGQAKVIAVAFDGKRDTCVINVRGPVTNISLNRDSLTLNLGADTVLSAILSPLYVIDGSISWTSTKPDTVKIISSNNGTVRIEALKPGIAEIVAKTANGLFDTCVVTVIIPIEKVVLSAEKRALNLKNDTITKVFATFHPTNATNKNLDWFSLNESFINIDSISWENGDTVYIKALRPGADAIYAVTPEGFKSDTCYITIAQREVDSVMISKNQTIISDKDTLKLNVGESFEVVTTVYPSNATNNVINLVSQHPDIASIDSISDEGVFRRVFIRALKEVTSIVHATPADALGGKKDSVIVKVSTISVEGVSLNKDTVFIYEGETETVTARITPLNATNDTLVWSVSDAIEAISPLKGVNSVFTFKALKADTAYVYVETKDLGFKDSVVVIIKEQLIAAEMVASGDVVIRLDVAAGEPLTGSFEAHFPRGFGLAFAGSPLDEYRGYQAKLLGSFETTSEMIIEELNDGVFIFEINPKVTTSSVELRSVSELPVVSIPYTIFDNTLAGSTETFNLKLKNVVFSTVSGDEFIEDEIIIEITPHINSTGNDIIGNGSSVSAYVIDSRLYVDSDKAETIYVYSLNGSLIYKKDKAEGLAVFDIDTQEKVLIVRGSSGWVGKVANK